MSTPIRFVGFFDFTSEGKFLWEILTQLKSMGVGRYVTKTEWVNKWPEEKSFVKIVKVRPEMDRWLQNGKMWGEWTFRSHPLGIYEFSKDLNRSDWRLINKHQEQEYLNFQKKRKPIKIPLTFPLPPLQKHLYRHKGSNREKDRAPLKICLDPQFESLQKLIERTHSLQEAKSPYNEMDEETYLDLYGKSLPTKIDAWSLDPATYSYHFHPQNMKIKK